MARKPKGPKELMFQLSSDTRLLYQYLSKAKIGDIFSYEAMGKTIGREISGAFPALYSARRKLQQDNNFIFGAIRGVGYKRLSDDEVVDSASSDRKRLSNGSKRAVKKLMRVQDYDGLSPKKKAEHAAAMSVFTAVAAMTNEKAIKRIEGVVKGRELPLIETVLAASGVLKGETK